MGMCMRDECVPVKCLENSGFPLVIHFGLPGVCILAGMFLPLVGGVDLSKQTHFNGLFKIQLPGLL
jgi:hypothetical protein